ncbi:hypothetical protein METBIDRAFT_39195 [Metschnikowia bicuspidata var. bicuspidata NRRL YB-4993]|uniref:Rho-GAP domain-containing protein n=1 Tax=Metschnikowia bicuspidata var. bicuspidata NRRL YB-4993 TaxID=869754 RepID=A0A1A0HDE8_9ASCO|nr:hypothetical protein METBIDRAFT_39195 [Metschnikowia bicuspidata var. bicuspidata NRRL YB-4993]OBA22041.1 hypothetical protein METBIDRAFT_39195 [Metschnikowia bicuspidata var. bicuspidata NRRL YB-4993]
MSFADSFWTEDYHLGHRVLFDELYEGVKENEDFIALFTRRMDLEFRYGIELENTPSSLKLLSTRHTNDDYVSTVKNAFDELGLNFQSEGAQHTAIAVNIRELVLTPFTSWCKEHEQRVGFLELVISEKYKQYSTAKAALEKLQKKYFNKCRLVEDFKTHYTEEELDQLLAESLVDEDQSSETGDGSNDLDLEVKYTFGGAHFTQATTKQLLADILTSVELISHKVAILGTYHNVSKGSAITQWLLDNLPELRGSVAKAEEFGQDLITHGFIRMIGSMSANKNFINSSQFYYQWRPLVFELTKLSEFDLSRSLKKDNYDPIAALGSRTNQFSTYLEDMKQAIGVAAVDYNDKSQYAKLVHEVNSLDAQYFETTKQLDTVRCEFEETAMDHLAFMQKCELDRLKAIKKVTFDFIATFSNKISSMKYSCDKLLLVEETIHPVSDLKFLIENYATGKFLPHVTLYDNYYNSNIKQTFGVDLNVKARLDKKAVPLLIHAVLSHLDSIYPELENDEERVNLWTKPVHLSKVHQVRQQLNELTEILQVSEILKASEPMIVTNVLKLYFMELPDSIVSHTFFDLIKTLYQNYPVGSEESHADKSRVTGLQNTLIELPVCNLATLDALLTHLNRLVKIISSKNEDLSSSLRDRLCREFGAFVLRPKQGSAEIEGKSVHAFNMATENLQQNFIADLFIHKDVIFGELRRRNSQKPLRNNSVKSDGVNSASSKLRLKQSSKSRLESRMKSAVQNAHENPQEKRQDSDVDVAEPALPSTPPPPTPSKSATSGGGSVLRRSTSPNKKKLNTYLDKQTSSMRSSESAKRNSMYSSANSSQTDHSRDGNEAQKNSRSKENISGTEKSLSKQKERNEADTDQVIVVD